MSHCDVSREGLHTLDMIDNAGCGCAVALKETSGRAALVKDAWAWVDERLRLCEVGDAAREAASTALHRDAAFVPGFGEEDLDGGRQVGLIDRRARAEKQLWAGNTEAARHRRRGRRPQRDAPVAGAAGRVQALVLPPAPQARRA